LHLFIDTIPAFDLNQLDAKIPQTPNPIVVSMRNGFAVIGHLSHGHAALDFKFKPACHTKKLLVPFFRCMPIGRNDTDVIQLLYRHAMVKKLLAAKVAVSSEANPVSVRISKYVPGMRCVSR
jgi:hypothetical protein